MRDKNKITISSILIFIFSASISLWAWPQFPEGALLVTHFDAHGNPNGYSSTLFGLLILPVLQVTTSLLFFFLPKIEPRRLNLQQSKKSYMGLWLSIQIFLSYLHLSIVFFNLGLWDDPVATLPSALLILFFVVGYLIRNSSSNFFIGVRTPWTLSSELSWKKTNKNTGLILMISSLSGLILKTIDAIVLSINFVIWGILFISIIAIVMSFIYWRKEKFDV